MDPDTDIQRVDFFDWTTRIGGQWTAQEGGNILFDLGRVTGAGEDDTEARVAGDIAQGEFGQGEAAVMLKPLEGGQLEIRARSKVAAFRGPAFRQRVHKGKQARDDDSHALGGGDQVGHRT